VAAVPADYQFTHALRRKGITLACFILVSTIVLGIGAYVDSYSVHEWDRMTDVGPFAMSVYVYGLYSPSLEDMLPSIRDLPGVQKAAYLEKSYGLINRLNESYQYGTSGPLVSFASDFLTVFPGAYELEDGRWPNNNSEISLQFGIAHQMRAEIGDIVNYTQGWSSLAQSYLLKIVGLFSNPWERIENQYYYYYEFGIAVTNRTLLNQDDLNPTVLLDIDRTAIGPFDAGAASRYLVGIEESIRALDPDYRPSSYYYTRYQVNDRLGWAVTSFISWRMMTRFSQVLRGGAVLLLVGLVMFLGIRFNMNDRRYESNVLISRGASRSDIEHMVIREIAGLTIAATPIGMALGGLVSRVAISSTGFFEFDQALLWHEPFLITIESIVFSVVLGLLLPPASFLAYRTFYSTKRAADIQKGRLARAARLFALVRWDFMLLVLTGLLMIALYSAGAAAKTNPALLSLAMLAPVALFLGLASLTIKGFRRGANRLSRVMSHITGQVPSYVGVRRIGKEASSAGPVAVIIVLSLTIAWGYAAIGASMPLTKANQARFSFGADITFHIDALEPSLRDSFGGNVTLHPKVQAGTALSVLDMMLSAGGYDYASVVAMDPSEYLEVGYDYEGVPLNSSTLRDAMIDLDSTPAGAIITSDIAAEYDLASGDTVRTSYYSTSEPRVIVFTVLVVVPALSPALLLDTGYSQPYSGFVYYGGYVSSPTIVPYYWWFNEVGKNTIWVNENYLASQVNLTADGTHLYCARTMPETNGTEVAQEILASGWNRTIGSSDWTSVTKDVSGYLNQAEYRMDSSVDTMFTISMILTMFCAFFVYAGEDVQARRREVALMKAMGSGSTLVAKVQGAEMLVLAISSIALVLVFAPVLMTNALLMYHTSYYIYPTMVTVTIPWIQLATILLLFLGSITAFVVVIACLSPRVKLATALNAVWAEASPYGGDF